MIFTFSLGITIFDCFWAVSSIEVGKFGLSGSTELFLSF